MNALTTSLLVGTGGFLGANARYWFGALVQTRGLAGPWGTLLINVTGSLIIGLFMGLFLRDKWSEGSRLFFAVGILGGYTTFSTFSYESMLFISEGDYRSAALYIGGSVIVGLAATSVGLATARIFAQI